ncbi:hypothetical protein [Methylobacterium sp. E-066]|uniref:hypothetical protein n=1 Tax=Methylobacterium sp. E-066 TaxID=2836584 RepID=UPI001FBB6B5A|nr:hypothetical protein [Methylobacterium sp. E-066]MCJ2140007.1 hypothetical protein [Methylobacterium sp. E-066]
MTQRRPARPPTLAWVVLLAALVPAPVSAWPEDRGFNPPRLRRVVRARPEASAVPPPVIVRGYLPRNHNVPMYNEPPRRGPAW